MSSHAEIGEFAKELRGWADCDARAGEPLGVRMRLAADKLEELAAENEATRQDIERYIQINTDLLAENERLRRELSATTAERKRAQEACQQLSENTEAALAEALKALDALDRMSRGVDWCDQDEQARRWSAARRALAARDAELAAVRAENERLRAERVWQPIETAPFNRPVDLWCTYPDTPATWGNGLPSGVIVYSRHKTEEYGWFGNQSKDGVPTGDGPDLIPVAWREPSPRIPIEMMEAFAAARVRAEDNAEGGEVLWCEICGERTQEVSTEHAGLCLECWISEGRPE